MHIRTPASFSTRQQSGIVLIEALIAVLLFSLGILALVGLQALMSKNVTDGKLRSESAFLANQIIGQMWVDQANLSKYAVTDGECDDEGYANCANWSGRVAELLPKGKANVAVDGTAVSIQLSWQLPGEEPSRFEIDANITN